MPRARDAVENHARDIDVISISGASECDGGSRFRLAGDIEHQHHRPPQQRRQIGGRAGPRLSSSRGAVEQSHHAFRNGNLRIHRCRRRKRCDQARTHRPAVQIIARVTDRDLVEGRINIVRSAFEGLHSEAATAKRA